MTSLQLITDPAELAAVMTGLDDVAELAVDTEFMREQTYYPRLCLVQIATPALRIYGVDPLAIRDLAPLAAVLASASIRKVLHAARQDIEVLLTCCRDLPRNLFDTQLAAALCGMPPQIGYGELVQKTLNVQLEKGHSRTDWTKRPLSEEQLHYAADDVRHLLPLRAELQARLEKLGRLTWFAADMERLTDARLYRTDPQEAWTRLKGLDPLDERRMAVARALAQWREQRAMDRDRPRGWILEDEAMYEIIRRLPESVTALGQLRSVPRSVVQKSGADIIAAVNSSSHLQTRTGGPLRRYAPPDVAQQRLLKVLGDTVKQIANRLELSPEILATRRDLQQLINGRTDLYVLKGWRREVVGEALLRQL